MNYDPAHSSDSQINMDDMLRRARAPKADIDENDPVIIRARATLRKIGITPPSAELEAPGPAARPMSNRRS